MGFSPVLSAAALLSLVAVVIAAPTARPQPKDIESLCLAVKNPWLNQQKCTDFLGQIESGIGSMTSFVQQEFVPLKGSQAAGPKYEPSVVFATWEGSYVSSGVNPVKQFEPVVLTAVVDGVLACKKEPFAYTKLFTFKQLGLSKPLVPTANGQGLQAMCSVTAMSQTPNPAGARLAQPWAYIWADPKSATADNSGLFLGCQDYAGGLKFDGVATVSCSFVAQLGSPSASSLSGRAKLASGLPGAAFLGADAGSYLGVSPPVPHDGEGGGALAAGADGGAAAVGQVVGDERPDFRSVVSAAVEGALARGNSR